MLGFAILGNYSLGLQFFSLLSILPTMSVKYLTAQDIAKIPNKKLKKIIVLMSIGVAILGFTVGPMIISYIFPKFVESGEIIRIISLAVIPVTIQSTYYFPKFWALEKNRLILFTSMITVSAQIIGILTLGPLYGTIGIASALVISMVCGTVSAAIFNRFFLKTS